jgi:hypothetical protein
VGAGDSAVRDCEAPAPSSAEAAPSVRGSVDSGYSPSQPDLIGRESSPGADEGDGLVLAALQLERLRLGQSAAKTGTEGRLSGRGAVARGGEIAGEVGRVGQPCQYSSIECAGCHVTFRLGERMESHGTALVHGTKGCRAAHDVEASQTARAELEAARMTTRYYAVYSDETGASGVYVEWAEAARLVDGAAGQAAHAVTATFESLAEATEFVSEQTKARAEASAGSGEGGGSAFDAGERQPGGRRAGSATRAALLLEKLSVPRLGRISKCIAGECEQVRGDGSETACLGGCGRTLHVETCAQMGRGYAALGNFTCVECRLVRLGAKPAVQGAESLLRRTAVRTMVLELGQGKEATTAGYAEYVRLEEEYVLGMGCVLDGGLKLPRHSEKSFKNFVTWFVLDADRACSLESTMRSAGAFLTKVAGLTDWTKLPSVKAHIKYCLSK